MQNHQPKENCLQDMDIYQKIQSLMIQTTLMMEK